MYFISIFIFSLMLNYLIFNLTLLGFFGSYFKGLLSNNFNNFGWFNKFLFYVTLLYLIVVFTMDIIYLYLSTFINFNLDGMTVSEIFFYLKKIFNQKIVDSDQQYNSSYLFPFFISLFGQNINSEFEPIIAYTFSMFTLSFIVFICFINIFGYIVSLYLISKYDIEIKFPKLKRIIKYYEKLSIFFIIFEGIIGFTSLIFIFIINLVLCGSLVLI